MSWSFANASILDGHSPDRDSETVLVPPLIPGVSEPSFMTTIEARPGWHAVNLRELWRYRELIFLLTWRDVKVRYKQTVLGAAWALLQPLATMLVFSLFFGRVAAAKQGLPYPLFVLAGLVPWMFFSNAVAAAAQSVVGSQGLVAKVYFPRLIIPISAVGSGLVDFAVSFTAVLAMMPFYGLAPGWGMLIAPLMAAGLLVAALGVGTFLSALTVAYRDFRYVVPFLVQFWMFATPCIYLQANEVGPRARSLLSLNPAYGLIANFRAAVLGGTYDLTALFVSVAVSLVLLVLGCLYFRHVERDFADII